MNFAGQNYNVNFLDMKMNEKKRKYIGCTAHNASQNIKVEILFQKQQIQNCLFWNVLTFSKNIANVYVFLYFVGNLFVN